MADTITLTDDRTGKTVIVAITEGVFNSSALRELDPDLRMYDPAFLSTAACASSITYLDGDAGILRYRGYPIEQLAEKSSFLEVAYLLLMSTLASHVSVTCSIALFQSPILAQDHHDSFISYMTEEKE